MRNRLHALCPYFAMFPEDFVAKHVEEWTDKNDHVLDPFSGRGTTVLQSLLMQRNATAIDINPVAFCVSGAKAQPPSLNVAISEIDELERRFHSHDEHGLSLTSLAMPDFFCRAFHPSTMEQLLFLRNALNWRHDLLHRFIAALVLGILHGEMGRSARYLSNQMPRTISPKPSYSLRYWEARNLWPEEKDTFENLRKEAAFRLSGELPGLRGTAILSDARQASVRLPMLERRITAVITSPPYFDVTNFEEDQWLRLWFLGGPPSVTLRRVSTDDRHRRKDKYWAFMTEVWSSIARLLKRDAILVCRIGGKQMPPNELTDGLVESLSQSFETVELLAEPKVSQLHKRQTNSFRPGSVGCQFEVDHVFRLISAY